MQYQEDLPVATIVRRFKEYLLEKERDQLLQVITHPDNTKHFGIYIRYNFKCNFVFLYSVQDLISNDVDLGNLLLNNSMKIM